MFARTLYDTVGELHNSGSNPVNSFSVLWLNQRKLAGLALNI